MYNSNISLNIQLYSRYAQIIHTTATHASRCLSLIPDFAPYVQQHGGFWWSFVVIQKLASTQTFLVGDFAYKKKQKQNSIHPLSGQFNSPPQGHIQRQTTSYINILTYSYKSVWSTHSSNEQVFGLRKETGVQSGENTRTIGPTIRELNQQPSSH